ncbi:leucine--trna cytoplasmic, partial [Nannochloropsis oceanica]
MATNKPAGNDKKDSVDGSASGIAITSQAGAPKSFARRDHLRDIEKKVQVKWAEAKAYETQAAFDAEGNPKPKFLATFPYPYMNGRLHLGHAYSMTKAEFAVRFHRLLGENALFPFGFHCTGMPIQAAANKLKAEMEQYGCPPAFPTNEEVAEEEKGKPQQEEQSAEAALAAKSKGKKSKAVCADHDRASGEGVGPQEYVLIKLKVLAFPGILAPLEGRNVFLAPATLRPETMYGQTNCFVLPEGVYGAYEMANQDVL